jgi:hypothetical protein
MSSVIAGRMITRPPPIHGEMRCGNSYTE